MEQTRKLIHKDKFQITGRGQVYTINLKDNGIVEENAWNGGVLRDNLTKYIPMNSIWEIDGKRWQVRGIESFATFIIREVGLLVREVNEQNEMI